MTTLRLGSSCDQLLSQTDPHVKRASRHQTSYLDVQRVEGTNAHLPFGPGLHHLRSEASIGRPSYVKGTKNSILLQIRRSIGWKMVVIAKTGSFEWTKERAEYAFNTSNLLGLSAATFLLIQAIQNLRKSKNDLSIAILVFPCIIVIDLLVRYPLLVENLTTRIAVIIFVVYYTVISTILAYPWMKYGCIGFGIAFATLAAAWILATRPEKKMFT